MPFAPILALTAPLCGLLILLGVSSVSPLRPYRRYVVPLGAGLSFLGVLFAPWEDPRPFLLSLWQPLSLFGTFPVLLADRAVWPLALAWAGAVAGSALVQSGRPQIVRSAVGAAVLAMLTFGLGALWGENLLTVLLAWAGFDLAWGIGMASAGLPGERVAWGVGGGVGATALLWMGALLLEKAGSGLSWPLMAPDGRGGLFLLLAALVRLGIYPFHFTIPAEMRRGRPLAVALLMEPLLAWGLLARMAWQAGFSIPGGTVLEALAAATFGVGGFLAWATTDSDQRVIWIGMATAGGVFWTGLHASPSAGAAWTAGGTAWALGLSLLYLGRGWEKKASVWAAASILGGLALLAAPLTSGGILSPPDVLTAILFSLGQALLTAAVAKEVLRQTVQEEPVSLLPAVAQVAGLAVSAIALVLAWGSAPKAAPAPAGWGAWVAGTLLGGGLLALERIRPWARRQLLQTIAETLRPEWAGRLLIHSLGRLTGFLDTVADVAEGPGAVLWALATFLLILVVVTRR
ncbi:MAG: hypothetical protein H5T61_12475 [Thermoflexales bacterium]|nr:hypothetical protein [Thermoflexales bacterium]